MGTVAFSMQMFVLVVTERCLCVISVKPASVTDLHVTLVNSTRVVVSWTPPAPDKRLLVHFQFTTDRGLYDSQWVVSDLVPCGARYG